MSRLLATMAVCGCVCLEMVAPVSAQKGKPMPSADVAADAVFRDWPNDRLKSDGVLSEACGTMLSESRYCGATNPTYSGLGPECSRIYSTSTSGDYYFRSQSSRCDVTSPTLRSVTIDLSGFVPGTTPRCEDLSTGNDTIERTVVGPDSAPISRSLNVCGITVVPDVRIEASTMFTRSTAVVTVPFSLHAPPLANTTQFILEFLAPIPVTVTGQASRALTSDGQTARLYEVTLGKGGKVVKSYVGEYEMSFSLTATAVP